MLGAEQTYEGISRGMQRSGSLRWGTDTVKHYRVIGQSVEQKQTFKLQFKITSSL